MKSKLAEILARIALVDSNKTLSLTNLAFLVCIGRLAFTPPDFALAVVLLVVLLNYNAKKYLAYKVNGNSALEQDRLSKLEEEVRSFSSYLEMQKLRRG